MTKAEKTEIINNLTEGFKEADAILACDFKGLTVSEFEALRKEIRKLGGFTQVAKNTLATIALKNAAKEGLTLKETNVFLWGKDGLSLIKAASKFADNSKEKFAIKFGYIDGKSADAAHIDALAKLPSKEQLIGMLLSVWQAPLRGFVTGLDNLSKKLAA
ncbi:MAG: 50S ribosomal protein L10 [Helicobacteraceae bacterium]|jgi:large subunit ribosomal protein L10|nr:50S ribosomal protein L10 [Helicobacteraceae bacterium]